MDKPYQEIEVKNPLEDLLEDESQASEKGDQMLKDLIKPFAYLGDKTQKVIFRGIAYDLSVKLRILLLFMSGLALKRLGKGEGTFSQKEVIAYFSQHGVPEGTIKVVLKQLRDERFIVEAQKSRYMTGYDKLSKIGNEFNKYGRNKN